MPCVKCNGFSLNLLHSAVYRREGNGGLMSSSTCQEIQEKEVSLAEASTVFCVHVHANGSTMG